MYFYSLLGCTLPCTTSSQILSPPQTHKKALGPEYLGTRLKKFTFKKELISWSVDFPNYEPVEYTSEAVLRKPVWADPDLRYDWNYFEESL